MDTPATDTLPTHEDLGKLTGWANPPGAGDLQADIDAARPSQQQFVTVLREWMDYLETKGVGAAPKRKGRSQVQPKLIKKHAEWRHPSMSEPFLSSSKLFTVKPRTWEDAKSAVDCELLLNYQFERYIDKVKFIDEYVRVGDNQGTVVVEVGWKRIIEQVPTEVPTISFFQINDPMQMEQLKNDIGLMRNPLEFNKLPVERKEAADLSMQQQVALMGVVTRIEVQMVEKVIENHPTLSIIDNMNLFIDPTCNGNIKEARFIGYSFETSKGELRADGRYKNIDMITSSSSANAGEAQHNTHTPNTFQFKDEERKRFVAYKMYCLWDTEKNGVLKPIVATWANGILLQLDNSPFSDGEFPFIVIPVNPIVKEWYGEPDGALLIENQKTVGALTRGMIDLLGRSANGQQGMPKQFLDAPNRRKFDNGEDYEYNPQMGNPEQLIVMHKYPEIPQSALILMQSQTAEAESQTGVNTFGGGVNAGSLGDVAAGIKGALAASAKREMSILRRYANGMAAIGRKFLSMSKDFMTDAEIIRITNEQFVSITREGIDGQHDITVEVASAEEDNLKAQELSFMLQTIGPSVDWGITRKVMAEIARLRKMPVLAKEISEYEPQPDPMAAAESQAKIRKLNAEAAAAESQSMADQARAHYYIAQARKLGSEADLNDLDFVEQESGTKHVRKMAELEAQSEANQDLAVTKVLAENGQVPAAIGFNQLTRSRL
jgi:hypothetical protein